MIDTIPYYGLYAGGGGNGIIESVTINFGATPSVAVIKFPIGKELDSGGNIDAPSFSLDDEIYLPDFKFRGNVWEINNVESENGEKWYTIVALDYRAKLNTYAIYRIYNISDIRAPRGTMIDEDGTIFQYDDEPFTMNDIRDDIETLLPAGFSISGDLTPTFLDPVTGYTTTRYDYPSELRFEFMSFVEVIDALVKMSGNKKWYMDEWTIKIVNATGAPSVTKYISKDMRITQGVAAKGYMIYGSHELKQKTNDSCDYYKNENTSERKEEYTVNGVTVTDTEDTDKNPILRASVYPEIYEAGSSTLGVEYPLSEQYQWSGTLLDNPAETPYIEANLRKLKKEIRIIPVSFSNNEFNPANPESQNNPRFIKAGRLVEKTGAWDEVVNDVILTSSWCEEEWYRIDANIDHRTGMIEVDYEKLKTIDSIELVKGGGTRGILINNFGDTNDTAAKSTLGHDKVKITYKFKPEIRATYVYKGKRIKVKIAPSGYSMTRGHIDDRYRKFSNYNIAEMPGYPIYTDDDVDDTEKMALLCQQRIHDDILTSSGSTTILIDPSISLFSNGEIAGLSHNPVQATTTIHYSKESLFSQFDTLPESMQAFIFETSKRTDEANTKSVSNSQDLRMTDTENRIRKEAQRKYMMTPEPHSHSGRQKNINSFRNARTV